MVSFYFIAFVNLNLFYLLHSLLVLFTNTTSKKYDLYYAIVLCDLKKINQF